MCCIRYACITYNLKERPDIAFGVLLQRQGYHMWCSLGESVGSQTCDIFSFLFDWGHH